MKQLLIETGVYFSPEDSLSSRFASKNRFVILQDCVLLRDEAERNPHLDLSQFHDRTDYEARLNHVHMPFDGSAKALESCLSFAARLRDDLSIFSPNRKFVVILSISGRNCTIRFHQLRPNETWLNEDLDKYKQEAVLVLT